jgi:hypothetical protein
VDWQCKVISGARRHRKNAKTPQLRQLVFWPKFEKYSYAELEFLEENNMTVVYNMARHLQYP